MIRRWMMITAATALLFGCGAKEPKPDDTVPADVPTDTTATTNNAADDEAPADGDMLPPPADVAAAPANAERSPSGLAWVVLNPGDAGERPTVDNTVKVHYTGWTTDGKMFDSSVVRNEPIEFPLGKVIAGWQEAVQMMSRGEKRRVWIPGDLAYDNSTREDAPKGMLVFEIELLDFH